MNENENKTTQNLWDSEKAVLRGRFIATQAYLKKQEKSQINNINLHLKSLAQSIKQKQMCFLELSCFFDDPVNVGNLISGSSAFSKTRLNIWKFTVHILLKPTCRILSITLLACEMSAIVWQFEHYLALPFFGIGMKTDVFQSCGHY